jgi:hypothetical protein
MYRLDAKNTKIAYKVLGVPANIAFKKNKEQREIDKKLIADETVRAR